MSTQAWLVMDEAKKDEVLAANEGTEFKVIPRVVDNPLASQLGSSIVNVGMWVAPARVLNGAEYGSYWASILGSVPIRVLDDEILFVPPDF